MKIIEGKPLPSIHNKEVEVAIIEFLVAGMADSIPFTEVTIHFQSFHSRNRFLSSISYSYSSVRIVHCLFIRVRGGTYWETSKEM